VKKHDPTYRLEVSYQAPSGKTFYHTEISTKFTEWFNTYGYLQKKEFQSWLARNIEVVGLADPQTAAIGETKYGQLVDDTITVTSGAESTAGQEMASKRGRLKKKP
jgi:Microsomal signal peptidase 25 kDa subunit (SPC25)